MHSPREQLLDKYESVENEEWMAEPEAVEAVEDELESIEAELMDLTSHGAFRKYLVRYIKEEKRRYKQGDVSEPLCDCGDIYCDLRRGTLPAAFRSGGIDSDSIDEFLLQHEGDGRVLTDAHKHYSKQLGELKTRLRVVHRKLIENGDH
ncbi:hypothetical protein [Natronocalculus amylovorans]|uniref:Uncharacterized protein n=1 Tax=Natronocalculus amylovorans TaxID=2917812 RepID=A0AAE3G0Y7_9EURY|nr:hypothetical protein [Natronocalculus amylovorans]MCL9818330.1 hypothetical protein [Natronocalculus amylovorans]